MVRNYSTRHTAAPIDVASDEEITVWADVGVKLNLSNTAIHTACGAVFSSSPLPNKADNDHPTLTTWPMSTYFDSPFFIRTCGPHRLDRHPPNVFSPAAIDLLLLRPPVGIEMDQRNHAVPLREL
jgi:hypothetical protein